VPKVRLEHTKKCKEKSGWREKLAFNEDTLKVVLLAAVLLAAFGKEFGSTHEVRVGKS